MANNCSYTIRAVADNKEALERLLSIMKYKDNEFYIYRCFCAELAGGEISAEGDKFVAEIFGDVAWSCNNWFDDEDNPDEKLLIEYEKDENGNECRDKPIYGTAHYTSLVHVAKTLGIAFELWADEMGCGFQQHAIVNESGVDFLSKNWCGYCRSELDDASDEDLEDVYGFKRDELDDLEYGFDDDYNMFMSTDELLDYDCGGGEDE